MGIINRCDFTDVSASWQDSYVAEVRFVSDLTDSGLADYARLTDVALRKVSEPANGLYIAESPKVIARALAAGHIPRSVLIQEQWLPDTQKLFQDHDDCTIYVGSNELLEALTGFEMHRGALASMHRPNLLEPEKLLSDSQTVVILEDIVDHTNVGAIFRAVAGLGADAVLITPRCADPLYRRSVRVSMGTVLQIPWTRLPEWTEAKALLTDHGYTVAALALTSESVSLREFAQSTTGKIALVLGAEGYGLSQQALLSADSVVRIPMHHGVDSLNVASAAAVALYALLG